MSAGRMPGGCRGSILRELAKSSPPLVPKHELCDRKSMAGYQPETIRKEMATLIRAGLVTEWSGSWYGTVVMLSERASNEFAIVIPLGGEARSSTGWCSGKRLRRGSYPRALVLPSVRLDG